MMNNKRIYNLIIIICLIMLLSGCSIKQMALNSVADALSGQGKSFSSDEDPELVGDALPFGLKLMESVRESNPEHQGIHLALSSGFVQYAYGWVLWPADKIENESFTHSRELKSRAHKLFLRALKYAGMGLDLSIENFSEKYNNNRQEAIKLLKKENIAQAYWFAGALAMAVKTGLDDPVMINRLTEVGDILKQLHALDPDWGNGTLHEALVSYYGAIGETLGGGEKIAKPHFDRAMELSKGEKPGLYLSWAESFSVSKQDKTEFISMVNKALEIKPEPDSDQRLMTEIMQRRAKWLLSRVDDLFLD